MRMYFTLHQIRNIDQNKTKNKIYHTVGTVLQYHTVGTVLQYHTVGTVLKYHTVGTVLKYHTVGTVLQSSRKIVERGKINTHNTQITTAQCPGLVRELQ